MPDRRSPLQTERVTAASKLPPMLGASLVLALFLLAVLKPWAAAAPPNARLGGAGAGSMAGHGENAGATLGADPTTDPLTLRKQCLDPDVWRLVIIERSGALQGRSLLPVSPVTASGPDDPRIVAQLVRAGQLAAIGYCVPEAIHPDAAAAEESVAIWMQVDGRALVPLSDARIMDEPLASVGEVYLAPPGGAPISGTGAPEPTWAEARYIFRIPGDSPASDPGWFAFSFTSTAAPAAP